MRSIIDGMKTSTKAGLIVIALALLAGLVVLTWRPGEREVAGVPGATRGPSFEVNVEKPRIARPLFGILPTELEEKLEKGGHLRFDHTSPGAEVVFVGPDRLELRAEGWDLVIETDGEGRVASGTRLVYPIELAEKQRTLRCRPKDGARGYLRTTARAGSDELDGSFLVELATCENVETGKVIEWPPAPLTVRGSFAGLPRSRR
jgi:hypothetical protein